jgi:hypothetical protein
MTAKELGQATARPWAPATVNDLPHGEPDIQFAVYAVNHIEHVEAALTEALALLTAITEPPAPGFPPITEDWHSPEHKAWIEAHRAHNRRHMKALDDTATFLAAHAAPEEGEA